MSVAEGSIDDVDVVVVNVGEVVIVGDKGKVFGGLWHVWWWIDLPLPLDHGASSLVDLLSHFSEAYTSELDCAVCDCRVAHQVSSATIPEIPDRLVLHIRRASENYVKSRATVRVPTYLSLGGRSFVLASAVVHIGDSVDSGHYVTILPPAPPAVQHWTCLDDSSAYSLPTPAYRNSWHLHRDATLLVYQVSDTSGDVPASPLVSEPNIVAVPPREAASSDAPLQLMCANLTSWFSGWPQLLADFVPPGSCIWLLTETHLSFSAARACGNGLQRIGLHGVFGCGSIPAGGSARNSSGVSTSCGVAVVSSLPVREVAWKTQSLRNLANCGRLLHVTCAIGGSQPLHVVVFYGVPGGSTQASVLRQNEEALSDIADECLTWGQVPIIIGGDFNMKLSDSLTIANLQLHGHWVDVALEHARRCNVDPPPTCFAKPGVSQGTRIDGILVNPVVAKSFVSLSYPCSGLPTHQPLLVDFSLVPMNAFVVKHKPPVRLKESNPARTFPSSEACLAHVQKLWYEVGAKWQRARNSGLVAPLWPLLTSVADSFYRWYVGLQSSKRSPVRGLPGPPCLVRVAPPRDRLLETATSVKNAARQRFIRSVEHLCRLRLKLAMDFVSASRFHEFQQLWQKVSDRAPSFVSSPGLLAVFAVRNLKVSCPDTWPKHQDLVEVIRVLETTSACDQQQEQRARLQSWRQSCRRRWRDPRQKRFVYTWVRDAWQPPVASVLDSDKNILSMDPSVIENVLWQKWQPIFCPDPDQESLPDFDAFWNRFGHYTVAAPVTLPPLTGAQLRDAVLRMSDHCSSGADGWAISEIKTWPPLLFDKLAELLCAVEASDGDWPEDLLLQIVTLVPKDEFDQRPISVNSVVYRMWASVRATQLCSWQESWAHPTQFGYRRGKRSVDPAWCSAAAAEHAWLSQAHRVGFFLDLAKAYDRIPHEILYKCLIASGLPVNFCNTWLSAIRGARKYLKSAYGLGRSFHVTRGLPQGDALACFGMNLIMSIWSRAVESESDVFVRSFADDATVEVERPDPSIAAAQLQKAISVTEEFTTLSGQKPNVGKCHVWSTSRKGRKVLRGLKMLGKPLVQKWHAKDLGCQTLFCGPARSTFLQARFAKARKTAKRVQCAPLRLEDKVQLVTGAASSLANYGLETCFIGESALARVRSAVVMAIWNHRRRFRSSHAVLLLFTQSHLTDPFHAQVYQCLTTLKRCLSQNPAVRAIWEPWWLKASGRDPRRPRGPVTLLCNVVRRIKWSWVSAWTLRTHQDIDIDLLSTDSDLFAHHVREACRVHGWQQALGLHKHFEGAQCGVDRSASVHLSEQSFLSTHDCRLLRSILTDAVWTASRLYHAGRLQTSACPCGHDHQDTEHFFWLCPHLQDIQSRHGRLVSLRADTGPWPACLELCGLVPLNFEIPGYNHIQLAHLVQAYLLDVVRRSWDLGWPNSDDKPQEESQCSALPVEPVLLKLPLEPPKLSSTTFPWPEQFCVDLLSFLKTLTWPKQPTSDGVSWAELVVNFEIVTGKALPRNPGRSRARHLRTYGEAAVPLPA